MNSSSELQSIHFFVFSGLSWRKCLDRRLSILIDNWGMSVGISQVNFDAQVCICSLTGWSQSCAWNQLWLRDTMHWNTACFRSAHTAFRSYDLNHSSSQQNISGLAIDNFVPCGSFKIHLDQISPIIFVLCVWTDSIFVDPNYIDNTQDSFFVHF